MPCRLAADLVAVSRMGFRHHTDIEPQFLMFSSNPLQRAARTAAPVLPFLSRLPRASVRGFSSALLVSGASTVAGAVEPPDTVTQLREEIRAMRQDHETRLKALEARLEQLQQQRAAASTTPPQTSLQGASAQITAASANASAPAAPISAGQATAAARSLDNRFNPAISLILSGVYTNLSKDPETWRIDGFVPGGDELGPGSRGFSLTESELNFSANIDSWLYGSLTLAVTPDDAVEVEEAFVQSTALPNGITLKGGRFFSAQGYLNEQHAHTWDFVDLPLAHQAFFGGQHKQEGVQAKWLLPTDQFIELGAEVGRGAGFPGTDRQLNGMGAIALMAHTGGDVGQSHNWRAGVSWLGTRAQDRAWDATDALDQDVTNTFTGRSRLWLIDGVWKWAPNGNARQRAFKLQGEYFRRTETGTLTYDIENANTSDTYRSSQSGWYVQGVYQFAPRWRLGLRHDRLDAGTTALATNASNLVTSDHTPARSSLMLDWSPSEFQRWRVQFSHDRAREGRKDTQFFLQYLVNLGAHGAHGY